MTAFHSLGNAILRRLDPETAHRLSIRALQCGLPRPGVPPADPRLRVEVAGLQFANPLGMAAGFDKNGEAVSGLFGLGFGHVEVGTVTPRPQPGNPRPRIFRLAEKGAVINRLGFNNEGHEKVLRRLRSVRRRGILGINIGANKDAEDFISDYEAGIEAFWQVADYFTANISSPNTPGLRGLQSADLLPEFLQRILAKRDSMARGGNKTRPVFLKIAPDLGPAELDSVASAVTASDLDGLVISNTTLSRHSVEAFPQSKEAGGVSGRPLFEPSTIILAQMRERLPDTFPIIGVGGVANAQDALAKIEAGADLVQIYTGMIYAGPELPSLILRGLSAALDRENAAGLHVLKGRKTRAWARQGPGEQEGT